MQKKPAPSLGMRRLLTLAQQQSPALFLTILASFLAGALIIFQAWLLSQLIGRVFLGGETIQDVSKTLITILSLVALQAILTWISEISAKNVAIGVKNDLRQCLFRHILNLGPAYTRGERSGALTTALMDGIEALDAYFSQYLPQLALSVFIPLGVLFVVFPFDFLSGIIFALTAPLIPLFMILIGKTAERSTKRQYKTLSLLSAHFLDSIQGLRTLKLFGRSKDYGITIQRVSNQFRDRTISVLRITFLSALVMEILSTLSTAIIAVQIGLRLLNFRITFEEALFILIIAPTFYLPLRMLGLRFHAGMAGTSAAREIFKILDITSKDGRSIPSTINHPPGLNSPPLIQFRDVTYTYPDEKKPALRDVSMDILPGEFVALVGPSGSGKSTLVQLLLGFIQPDHGVILINGKPIQQIDLNDWRKLIAWVPQNPYLFHDTLISNLCLGVQYCSDPEIESAVKTASLSHFIDELPEKFQTVIMESGARLSSGQAQRLALARAILKNAPLLIMDEPTSKLDPATEYQLEKAFQALIEQDPILEGSVKTPANRSLSHHQEKRSILTIAHRLKTVIRADRIFVLEDGRLCESGTHDQLIKKGGVYAEMLSTPQTVANILGTRPLSSPREVFLSSPKTQTIGMATTKLAELETWLKPTQIQGEEYQPFTTVRRLLGFLGGSWIKVVFSILLGTATIASNIALMGTSAWLISTAALHPSIAVLQVAVVGVRAFGIGRGVFRYLERLTSHQVTFRLLARLRRWFYDSLEPLVPARLMELRSGDLLNQVVAEIEALEYFYVRVISPPLIALVITIGTLFFFWQYNPNLMWSLIVPLLLVGFWLPLRTVTRDRELGKQLVRIRSALRSKILDGIQGLEELLAFRRADEWGTEMDQIGIDLGQTQQQMASRSGLNNGITLFLGNLGALSVLAAAIPLVNDGSLDGVMLAVFALVALAYFEALSPLPKAAETLGSSLEAAQGIFTVVDTKPAVQDPPDANKTPPQGTHILVRDLCFRYRDNLPLTLSDISLSLVRGKRIAIVGPSGAGKSTLVHLLLRYWEYDSGYILLDGKDLRRYQQEDVRACFSVIPANPYFFNTTVRENLRLAKPTASSYEIKAAAKDAEIHHFIKSLPQGYNTVMGEWGTRFSSGQLQRLSITRALLKASPILITDEPTANLDLVTEREILERLISLSTDRALLHITHRLVKLELFNEIIVLDHGRIIERGRHEELLVSGGLYQEMWEIQEGSMLSIPKSRLL